MKLSDKSFLSGLKRIRNAIKQGREFKFINSTAHGDKYTECSWGTCSELKADWPNPEDQMWPEKFPARFALKYNTDSQHCPLEMDLDLLDGCFWSCRARKKRNRKKLSRAWALELYNIRIAEFSELINKLEQKEESNV